MGKVASDYTKKKLNGKYVDLELEGKLRGKYGRLLAYVFVDGRNFNLELVRQGLSPYYTKYGLSQRYDKEFREVERFARDHRLNIWGDPDRFDTNANFSPSGEYVGATSIPQWRVSFRRIFPLPLNR